MENSINANVFGTVVNVFINHKLHSKNCGSIKTANEMYHKILKAKENPTDDAISDVLEYLSKRFKVARKSGLEYEPETGNIFLKGFNTPIPELLVDTMENYIENKFPMEAINNFWKLLMANPDHRVRESLFYYIQTHKLIVTDKGYFVTFKVVDFMKENPNDLPTFVSSKFLFVKQRWFTSPKKYVVYRDVETEVLNITKAVTFNKWDLEEKGVELVGNLSELHAKLEDLMDDNSTVFTDMHTHKMEIRLGVPVTQERRACDADPSRDCSNGLHVGAPAYVERFGGSRNPVLMCLVNPMHVIAVPNYDHSKMRVCEYFPYALIERNDDGTFGDIVEQQFFENDYLAYEEKELTELLRTVNEEEAQIIDKSGEVDDREWDEVLKVLESRVVDISG